MQTIERDAEADRAGQARSVRYTSHIEGQWLFPSIGHPSQKSKIEFWPVSRPADIISHVEAAVPRQNSIPVEMANTTACLIALSTSGHGRRFRWRLHRPRRGPCQLSDQAKSQADVP
eukprot:scaffold461405_cov19-Prasinocladus_malaysianus.AAC.1